MKRPPALTKTQKKRFSNLRSQLLTACESGDVAGAKLITNDIKSVLIKTGHHTKYKEILLHYCELLILKRKYKESSSHLKYIIQLISKDTRLYQEATLLFSICKMHDHDLNGFEYYLKEALHSEAIKDESRRRDFLKRISERIEEEALLVPFEGEKCEICRDQYINDIQTLFVNNCGDDEIFETLGKSVPQKAIEFMINIHEVAKLQLTHNEMKMLPPPSGSEDFKRIGKSTFNAISRRIWMILCPPESNFQKILKEMQDPAKIVIAIFTEIAVLGIPYRMMAACISTIIVKSKVECYCKKYKPKPIMSLRYKRS